jgi:hypothetical protein
MAGERVEFAHDVRPGSTNFEPPEIELDKCG